MKFPPLSLLLLSLGFNESASSRDEGKETQSFFGWFSDTDPSTTDGPAEVIKDDIWPNPLQYFLVSKHLLHRCGYMWVCGVWVCGCVGVWVCGCVVGSACVREREEIGPILILVLPPRPLSS